MHHNLLTHRLIRTTSGSFSLPGLLSALVRDEVDGFPALRPHQGPALHMFLVQLGAMAMRRAGLGDPPSDEEAWRKLLRSLTPGFADDEPWHLIVEDWTKPAFMQSPVPADMKLSNPVPTPDALDMLITSRNHDLKQTIARQAEPEDWFFALISLQTMEGYGGKGNQGIARMNGGSSSRPLLSLAPLPATVKGTTPRLGTRFRRDVMVLLKTYEAQLEQSEYDADGGIGLTWLEPWPEGEQLQIRDLDIWFIEVCRRIRLTVRDDCISAVKGNSAAARINARQLNGALGDPWAPVHKVDRKSLTLAGRDFDYRIITELLFSGDWEIPLLARLADVDVRQPMALVAEAISRGNSKTEGFKSRVLPISSRIAQAFGTRQADLNELAKAQVEAISSFAKALGNALSLLAAKGDRERRNKDHYGFARAAQDHFTRAADIIFFDHLWARFKAQERGQAELEIEERRWAEVLAKHARSAFRDALPTVPCSGIYRARAEARAERAFEGAIRHHFPDLISRAQRETEHAG
ncbi:type I-E CRISPR-associated protein Cse1/CasA [Acidiphilium multivorum]|uniref:type I-E CRISPR-associated protein Cse1/CasA n=1 Tax=Acidiphilium multivorum TaxID=62140 RepID=UPI0039C97CA9